MWSCGWSLHVHFWEKLGIYSCSYSCWIHTRAYVISILYTRIYTKCRAPSSKKACGERGGGNKPNAQEPAGAPN
jgi:hypothetical protein